MLCRKPINVTQTLHATTVLYSSIFIACTSLAMPGWRQRAEEARQRAAPPAASVADLPPQGTESAVVAILVFFWAWGMMSPQTIQKICNAMVNDLARMGGPDGENIKAEIVALARIGSSGNYPNHMNADLNRYLEKPLLTTLIVQMPMKKLADAAAVVGAAAAAVGATIAQCMLLPHLLFSVLGNNFPTAWEKLMCPSRQRLTEFWANMARSPQLKGTHPYTFHVHREISWHINI